jgi:energy-coupling factor transporter transmembrane protein EcfT
VAELTAFAYLPGASILHRLDVRIKLAWVAAASLASLQLDFAGIGLMALPLLAAAAGCRRSVRIQSSELRWIGLLLAFVFAARALSTDGPPAFSVLSLDITREGLREGALIALRLALVFLVGTLLMATTRPAEVKAGVQWFLKPLPFVPAERVGTMLGLLVRFIPVIFEEVSRVSDAQRARAVENRRNPLRRAVKLGVPIMRRVFERSDQLALAMEARCYSERRTAPVLRAARRDWLLFGLSCGWLAVVLAV